MALLSKCSLERPSSPVPSLLPGETFGFVSHLLQSGSWGEQNLGALAAQPGWWASSRLAMGLSTPLQASWLHTPWWPLWALSFLLGYLTPPFSLPSCPFTMKTSYNWKALPVATYYRATLRLWSLASLTSLHWLLHSSTFSII